MNVTLDTRDVELPPHSGKGLSERFKKAFDRLDDAVRHVHVCLKDVNGPRGGEDKVCQLQLHLVDGDQIIVRTQSSRLTKAIGDGLRKAKTTLTRHTRRKRDRRRVSLAREALPAPA